MAGRIVAAVVGVPSPETLRFRGKTFAFRTALGVQNDVDWYAALLARRVPRQALDLTVLSSPTQTSVAALRTTLAAHAATVDHGDTFVLTLVGHGFQARDDNGEEADGFDEVFAAADGAFGDDDFAAIWARLPQQASLVVIADTCSADSIGLKDLEVRPVDEHVTITASGPWRLSIGASMDAEKAGTVDTRFGRRGVLSQCLESGWGASATGPGSYREWFRAAAQFVAMSRPQQHPQLRYLGPDESLLHRPPFT